MTHTSHTPGPWAYADYYGKKGKMVVGHRSICEMVYADDVAEADARLIAASPQLYDYVAMRASLGDTDAITLLREAGLAESNQTEGAVS